MFKSYKISTCYCCKPSLSVEVSIPLVGAHGSYVSAEDNWKKRVHRCGWCEGLPRKPRLWVLTVHASWVSVCLPVWSVYLYLAARSCATLCNRLDCSPPGYSGHGIFQARILNFSGKNFLLQGIFLTQGSNPCLLCLLHWGCTLCPLGHQGSPCLCTWP